MGTALRPIGHEDRLSLVEHLDELRTRIFICLAVYALVFGICMWQNDRILDVVNKPLEQSSFNTNAADSDDPLEQAGAFQNRQRVLYMRLSLLYQRLARGADDAATRRLLEQVARDARATAAAAPRASPRRPVTLGVGEPFMATIKVAAYAALLVSLPLLLYQAYAFVLPAFSPTERQVALPLMAMVPFLFIAGVAFCYLLVLPNALEFLVNFNDDSFDILVQARDYYRFAILALIALGLLFQIPIGVLAVTRMGILSVAQLRHGRRYAILVIAVLAMLLPGTDPVTMLIAMGPLWVLYEASILLAALLDRRAARARGREAAAPAADDDADPQPDQRD